MSAFTTDTGAITSLIAAVAGLVAAIGGILNRSKLHAIKKDTQFLLNGADPTKKGSEDVKPS